MNLFKKVLDKRLGTWYYSQAVSENSANDSERSLKTIQRTNKKRNSRFERNWAKNACEVECVGAHETWQEDGLNIRVWSWLRTNAGGVLNTCKSNEDEDFGFHSSGGRVSNAWAICPTEGDNNWKQLLIPHKTTRPHGHGVKGAIRCRVSSRPIR